MAKKKHLHILPTLVCLVCPLTFVITFIVAWQMGHVSLAFPYISDTGNYAPESCIFSQLLNITSMLLALCVYIRYLQVKQFANFRSTIGHRLSANNVATLLGYLSCLGMDIVANFQVKYVWQIHYIGACLCFIGGTVYFIFQTFFSYYLSKKFDSGFVFYARSILCFLSVLMTIAAIVPGVVSGYYYTGLFGNHSRIDVRSIISAKKLCFSNAPLKNCACAWFKCIVFPLCEAVDKTEMKLFTKFLIN
ncbi:DNA damage-regulated autophagy modulator protein 2-like isoform X2 [Rhodnius prolixus]|uniref:DNA damage-regulated autophagy modulator protein 2-like isoform X2 n=1 Tax=Rhodnius prolixus TaxID=13249 RepID=UPI003D18BF40